MDCSFIGCFNGGFSDYKILFLQKNSIFVQLNKVYYMNLPNKRFLVFFLSVVMCFAFKMNVGAKSIDGHEYVDLGLPSGTLWAACNVGASKPHEFGGYYSWGETQTKDTYVWETYKYIKNNRFTKYNTQDEDKGPIALTADDDAASVNWGNKWKTPKASDFEELGKFCYYELTRNYKQTGVSGIVFTSKINGRILFLPAAGDKMSYDDESLKSKDAEGAYLTSELDTSRSSIKEYGFASMKLCSFTFEYGEFWPNDLSLRYMGRSVRPVAVERVERAFQPIDTTPKSYDFKVGKLFYKKYEKGVCLVKGDIAYNGDLVIPGVVSTVWNKYEVVKINDDCFANNKDVKSVDLSHLKSMKFIPFRLFEKCDNLMSVKLPPNITSIPLDCFRGCKMLSSVSIPQSVTQLSSNAFRDCESLKSIVLPKGLEKMDLSVFSGCKNLESIVVPDKIDRLQSLTFEKCSNLVQVKLPAGLTSLGYGCFYNCERLKVLKADGVTSIEEDAFTNCKSLPAKVLLSADGKSCLGILGEKHSLKRLSLPNTVEFICDDAFSNCANLQHVKLPDAVTKIGNRAFYKCSSLATVDLPHHNVKLGESVFALSGLIHMEIPAGVDSLPEGAFYQCVRLKKVKLPIHMYVAPETFVQCDSLQEVSLPEDLKVIEYNTFLHCKNLESVKIPSTVEVVRNGAFMQCGKLDINIPSSIDTIETGAFYGCGLSPRLLLYANNTKCYGWVGEKDACVSVEIPDSVEELNAEAFANCKKLEHVSVPKSVKSIPNYAFYNCESLRSVNIPASITSFGIRSFTNCKNLPSSFINGLPENAKVPDYSYE